MLFTGPVQIMQPDLSSRVDLDRRRSQAEASSRRLLTWVTDWARV